MVFVVEYDRWMDKWMVKDGQGNTIMLSSTKEGAEQIRDDFNEID